MLIFGVLIIFISHGNICYGIKSNNGIPLHKNNKQ